MISRSPLRAILPASRQACRRLGPVEVLPRLPHERVEGAAMVAADALLELVIDVGRHLRVGVAPRIATREKADGHRRPP